MQPALAEKTHYYKLRSVQEIYDLSRALAQYFPEPGEVMTGIYELLLNAVEHGNLGIDSETKQRLMLEGKWEDEIMYRLSLPENIDKSVEVSVVEDASECRLTIADQGKGFRWRQYLDDLANLRHPPGHGLLIALSSGFDNVTFNDEGNIATCIMQKSPVRLVST